MGKTLEECYEVLGLEYGATEDEIKSAYRKKALQCHPDKNPDDPLSTQKFQELGHAYRRLTGEEDSDSDDEYDDDDMELWRDFFFFLFRDEILAKVRCKCYKCGRAGENEDDDFLASLAKEQEERCQFTEEEMAQFTSFTSLKEQREANKKKYCDERNQSNSKPEQKATKGNKPKLKSNKQLKVEQWKREKEISEIAAQINQPNPKIQGRKGLSKDAKTKEPHPQKSCDQPGVAGKEKFVKDHTEGGSNKRNARKKKNRNKQRQQSDKETDSNQNDDFTKTTHIEQKLASSFVVQDAVKNVTIKPETTRRQDDVTGRLPRYTRFISPRMMKARARAQDSTLNSNKNAQEKQTGRGWFETQKPETAPRPSYGANNIWQKRQEKQQFLAELQPSNQNDEELQLQMALELSKKQAEIEAQQREISMLEKQMEETLQLEEQLQQTPGAEENQSATATLTGPDSFPPQGIPVGCEPASSEFEDWEAASDSEDEWQESEQASNFSGEYASNDDDEASEQIHETKYNGLPLEDVTSSDKDNTTVPKLNVQLPQPIRGRGSQSLDCCPYGKNCCLGKRCMYPHPPSVDNRKSQQSVGDSSSSQDQCDPESADECYLTSDLTEKHIAPTASCEELPGTSELGHSGDNTWQSYRAYNCNESITNSSLHPLQSQTSANYEPESTSDDTYATQQPINAGDLVKFGSTTSVGETGFSKDENQCHLASDKLENIGQSLSPGLESQSSLEDKSSSCQEKSKTDNANDLQIRSNGHLNTLNGAPGDVNNGNSTAKEASAVDSNTTGPTVYVIADQSQFPFGLPAASALMQSAAALPPLGNLSAGANLQNSPQNSSSLPLNYANQMSSALPANLIAQTFTALPQSSVPAVTIHQTLSATTQNSASPPSLGATRQTPMATSQPNTVAFSTSTQTAATNGFPAVPGFPFHQSLGATRQTPAATPQPNTVCSSTSPQTAASNGFPAVPGFPFHQSLGATRQTPATTPQSNTVASSTLPQTAATNGFPAVPGFPFLPNVFPFLNPANIAANASLMAAAAGGMPFPMMTGPSNSVHNQQGGGFMMNQPMLPPYLKTDLAGGMSPLGQYLPMQAQLNGFPGMTGEGNGQVPRPSQAQPQPSQAGVTNDPQSAAPTVPQPLRFPFPFIDPQAFLNMNSAMAMGLPYSMLQNGCQTSLHSGLTPSQAQVNNKTTEQCRVEHMGTGVTKPTDIKRELGEERGGSVSCDSKTPSLRRPVTVPKVIQHQASK